MENIFSTTKNLCKSENQFQNSVLNAVGIATPPLTVENSGTKPSGKSIDFQKWRDIQSGQNRKLTINREQRTREQFTVQYLTKSALKMEKLVDADGIFKSQCESVNFSESQEIRPEYVTPARIMQSSQISMKRLFESDCIGDEIPMQPELLSKKLVNEKKQSLSMPKWKSLDNLLAEDNSQQIAISKLNEIAEIIQMLHKSAVQKFSDKLGNTIDLLFDHIHCIMSGG